MITVTGLKLVIILIILDQQTMTATATMCEAKVKCTDYITWGTKLKNETLLNTDARIGLAQGVWNYNVDEKEKLTITYVEVNNVVLEDCVDCKACILSGGVGHSYVSIGLVIPPGSTSSSYYHRMIYGHWLKAGEKPTPGSCNDYCESATKKSTCL